MAFEIKPAVRENVNLRICLAGESGSGKTHSSLMLAAGICNGAKPLIIDTESRKSLMDAGRFEFDHLDFEPPFTPERFVEAVRTGERAGYPVIILDSISDEWEGPGGMLDMRDAIKTPGPGGWNEPKRRHKEMLQAFKQCRSTLILCGRADEKLDLSRKDERGKVVVTQLGWTLVQERRFRHSMVILLTLHDGAPGAIDLSLPNRIPEDFRMTFVDGRKIDRAMGEQIGKWARGEDFAKPDAELWARLRNVSHEGTEELKKAVEFLDDAQKAALGPIRRELWDNAKRADANRAGEMF